MPETPVLDPRQLIQIEAVHRGFLYQHLYATACLLLAGDSAVSLVAVERDEDIELHRPGGILYVQVKTRLRPLSLTDIEGALSRFRNLRAEHVSARRSDTATFVIAANVPPNGPLAMFMASAAWPADVGVNWPDMPGPVEPGLPKPPRDLREAISVCTSLAARLPFGLLAPDVLVWKLAGGVAQASAGLAPWSDHAFRVQDLPALFSQMAIQLQDFPAPPALYRAQTNEPSLVTSARSRIITGYSGAGKTSWVAEASVHSTSSAAYFDIGDTPGTALASSLSRELAAVLFGRSGGGLGEMLLPGSSGIEILRRINTRVAQEGLRFTIVLDNVHRISPPDIKAVTDQLGDFSIVMLSHPGRNAEELQALLQITAEHLGGWGLDTIAAEAAHQGCRADVAACQRILALTGGLPLYALNAVAMAKRDHGGSVADFCTQIESQTHTVETAQELILARVFEDLPLPDRAVLATLSLSDIPLKRIHALSYMRQALVRDDMSLIASLRTLRTAGAIEVFGDERLKVHDALRVVGLSYLQRSGVAMLSSTRSALKDMLVSSLPSDWSIQKVGLLLRTFAALGEIKPLVEIATDEIFHEMGLWPEVIEFLERAAESGDVEPDDRVWALDGLAFGDMKRGKYSLARTRVDAMGMLIDKYQLGDEERLAQGMKRMSVAAAEGNGEEVKGLIDNLSKTLPNSPGHMRVFRYNAAQALFFLENYNAAADETEELIEEYFGILGLRPSDLAHRNASQIRPLLKPSETLVDDLKHLADSLDLFAMARNKLGEGAGLARLHAMKFYELAQAPDSLIRVGQDFVDEMVAMHDFAGARGMIETNLIPTVTSLRLAAKIVPVRSQYAVVLALCGEFDAAEAEMEKLGAYEAGLDERGRAELAGQRVQIAHIRRVGPPPQRHIN